MKIDKKRLVELLVEKTSMKKEVVEEQLDQLVERILDAARRGKALEIKEFGMFYFDQDGTLKFEVADELSTEISFKYAGMKPLELKPERDASIVISDADEDTASENLAKTIAAKRVSDQTEKEPVKAGTAAAPVKKPTQPSKRMADTKKSKESKRGPLVAVVLVVVLILAGIFYFRSTQTAESVTEPVLTEEEVPAVAEQDQVAVIQEDEVSVLPDTEQQEPDREQTVQAQVSTGSGYGLRGSAVSLQGGVYSIVVHSMSNEAAARRTVSQFTEQGYRAFVSTRTVGGSETWRVSLGQFSTIDEAILAARELPSPYNDQNFIQRLQ